jgi:hypothetical protein
LQPKTLSNAIEIRSQTRLVTKRIRAYKSFLPRFVIEIVLQVKEWSSEKGYSHTLLAARVAKLEAANNVASESQKRGRSEFMKIGHYYK